MFETVETNLRTLPEHGGFALLEAYSFQGGRLKVQVRAAGSNDGLEIRFVDVIGFTMSEDVFGSNGGQITRECLSGGEEEGQPVPNGFFWTSISSPTIKAVRESVPPPFSETVEQHVHFLMSLREHELSFVANGTFDVEPMSFGMAS